MLVDFCNASLPWKVATDLTEVYGRRGMEYGIYRIPRQIGNIKTACRQGSMLVTMMSGVPAECTKVLYPSTVLPFYRMP